jgi:DDE superfamily endonuclease
MSSFRYCANDVSLRAAAHCQRFFARHGISLKKILRAEERKRADVARARRRCICEQGWLDITRLAFIDETAITTNMVRLHGWSPSGERLITDAPMGHWETVTFIAGLRQTGIVAPMVIKGAMNGEAFLAYIEAMSGADAQAWRHRGGRQRVLPQGRRCGGGDPECRRKPQILAAVFSRT